MPYTPSDIFIFTLGEHLDYMKACLVNLTTSFPNFMVVPIPPQDWTVPENVANETLWHAEGFDKPYRWG